MTLHGFRSSNHPQQVANRAKRAAQGTLIEGDQRDDVDDRSTPLTTFRPLDRKHNFTVDAAASSRNALLPRYWTIEDDGLEQSWTGERVWCNPPYSEIERWIRKAITEVQLYGCPLVVLLLPANRTERKWWQEWVEPLRDRGPEIRPDLPRMSVEFLSGRLRFDGVNHPADGKGNRPPFGCCLITITPAIGVHK